MMGARAALVLSLLCAFGDLLGAEENDTDAYNAPAFCRTYECPKYQVAKQYETFELRVYEQSRWVTTQLELDFLGIGLYRSFRRLFKYINGQNSEGIKMKMTVPVRMYVPRKSSTDKNATMSFFVPSSVVNPPQPLNQEVYLESFPQKSIYVKSFSGYALKPVYEKKAKMLLEELTDLGLQFDSSYGTAAGYNDPLTIFDRHNEVWYTSL